MITGASLTELTVITNVDEILLADGFEEAFAGVVESFGTEPKACYDKWKCYDILMDRDGMSFEEADEYFQINVAGAYVGKRTPVFIANEHALKNEKD